MYIFIDSQKVKAWKQPTLIYRWGNWGSEAKLCKVTATKGQSKGSNLRQFDSKFQGSEIYKQNSYYTTNMNLQPQNVNFDFVFLVLKRIKSF